MGKKQKNQNKKDPSLRRKYRRAILFNQREIQAINYYCDKYKIRNRSKFMREIIISSVLRKFDEDYPSLFEETPTLFNQKTKRR